MSRVTDVILITELEEEANVQKINDYMKENVYAGQQLKKVDQFFGGTKWAQLDCYGGAINHLGNRKPLIDLFRSLKWENPERNLLILNEEEHEKPEIYQAKRE